MINQTKLIDGICREARLLWPDGEMGTDAAHSRSQLDLGEGDASSESEGGDRLLQDLLRRSGEEFVVATYIAVLGRQPDKAGLSHYLAALAAGRLTKPLIIGRLRFSREGRDRGVPVRGLLPILAWHLFFMLPLVGPGFATLDALVRLRRLDAGMDQVHAALRWQGLIIERERGISQGLRRQVQGLVSACSRQEASLKGISESYCSQQEAIAELHDRLDKFAARQQVQLCDLDRRLVSLYYRDGGDNVIGQPPRAGAAASGMGEMEQFGLFYLEFEKNFRGSAAELKEGFRVYLPLAHAAMSDTGGGLALDLGCGGCEWLELLRDEGMEGLGVDSNSNFAETARDRGMQMIVADLFQWLAAIPNDYFALVTSFHVIEHLSFPQQMRVLGEIFRTLKPGGKAILESPNPRNILVGSGDFYRDPTHLRPVFPDTLGLVGESVGFAMSKVFFFTPGREALVPIDSVSFERLDDYLNISRDFAWTGTKPFPPGPPAAIKK